MREVPRAVIRDNYVTSRSEYGIRVQPPPKRPAILTFLESRRTRDVLFGMAVAFTLADVATGRWLPATACLLSAVALCPKTD